MAWQIETEWTVDATRAFLEKHRPWRANIEFPNGLKTTDFETMQPFQSNPLNKLRIIKRALGAELFRGARVLDIGFNCGYNSIALAQEDGAVVTGIDVEPRHKAVAESLAQTCGVRPEFLLESAEDFERQDEFDILLHLGTLYHLESPARSGDRRWRGLLR